MFSCRGYIGNDLTSKVAKIIVKSMVAPSMNMVQDGLGLCKQSLLATCTIHTRKSSNSICSIFLGFIVQQVVQQIE
jgi:hypothetical protein